MPEDEIIGLIPAAGLARRISPLPCSKEILPVGLQCDGNMKPSSIRVVSHYLLEEMCSVNMSKVFMIPLLTAFLANIDIAPMI